jgi:hypothetical protein
MLNTVLRNSTRILLKRSSNSTRQNAVLRSPSFNRNRILIREKTLKNIFESSNKPKEGLLVNGACMGVCIGFLYYYVVEPIIDVTRTVVKHYNTEKD